MTKTCIARTGLSLALLALTLPAVAQNSAAPAQRIEISATRLDVRTLCPSIDDELPARLARALHKLQNQALVEVQFQIEGRRIAEVATRGGSFDTRLATRRAVGSLACDNGSAGSQTVRFEVLFNLDDRQSPPDRTAALAVAVTQSGQLPSTK